MHKIKVWDGFIRSFHWLLVIAIAALYFSAEEGMMELHFVAGFFTLALLVTRLIWGLIGSKTAKLSALFHSPSAALKSFKQTVTDNFLIKPTNSIEGASLAEPSFTF